MESLTKSVSSGALIAVAVALIHDPLLVSLCLSVLAAYWTYHAISLVGGVFVAKGQFGKDLLKPNMPVLPESQGVVAGAVYFAVMFLFIPIPFVQWFAWGSIEHGGGVPTFPHEKLGQFLSGLLALLSMLLLGFADDVLDIRWRVKLWFPMFASIPLLTVYYVTYGVTHIKVPLLFRAFVGTDLVDLGPFYYVYMSFFCVFCTNSVNILAGINGVEGGQSLILALSIVSNDLYQTYTSDNRLTVEAHLTSLFFILPFIGVTIGYLFQNWYPAKVFGGDTYAYFAGMIFAVVGILGHFSQTVLLFHIPQIFNFLYSCPQVFGFVECPRHRMPTLNHKTLKLEASRVKLNKTGSLGRGMIRFLEIFYLVHVNRDPKTHEMLDCNNLTLINLILVRCGSLREWQTTLAVMAVQVLGSILAITIRYALVHVVYN
ncbi:phospho-N-acetylmuramoyl-pentapeptide-transferase [Synchytrium microbalum]|uniref:UDP-N-acetylglucosamine--dolichyl-phosphate N-acetylglucosaminephosphotransferase n=1 Tax=Synchytrium microbalum TaxID=1806994 RepID=A0A507CDQ6_9FUNG|nr:phospho-N-acetylmuramoyl-pentapeptide-transferase [Synchytrium microbalum]TPX37641.1 phospho-N-acetylmuramoyl-pentapeptide-transferase [Synchytrium microbalum]